MINKSRFSFLSLIMALLFVLLVGGTALAAEDDAITLLVPKEKIHALPSSIDDAVTAEPFITRTGVVSLDGKGLLMDSLAASMAKTSAQKTYTGLTFAIGFFADRQTSVVIERESLSSDRILNLIGRKTNQDLSNFTMTLSEESFLITLHDLDEDLMYRVVGDTSSGIGRVTEIDLKKMPPQYQ